MNLYSEQAGSPSPMPSLLFFGFNQDAGCLSCGTSNGFIIFNVDPFKETFRRQFTNGGIGIVEMLFRCNLIALVGGGRNPRYPTNKVMIWDDNQSKCIGELTFKNEVIGVRLRRDRVVVVLNTKVYVYRFSDLKLVDQIPTIHNPKALVALCADPSNNVLAVPGITKGSIRVELYDISKSTDIKAHDSDLAQFALNVDGSRLATSSDKGTLVRLWDSHSGEQLREFRRGMDRAEIFSICFDPFTNFLACSSDKGTVHIFSLGEPTAATIAGGGASNGSNTSTPIKVPADSSGESTSVGAHSDSGKGTDNNDTDNNTTNKSLGIASVLRGMLPPAMFPKYLTSEWSFAQVRGIEGKSICAFDKTGSKLHVVCSDGTFIVSAIEEGSDGSRLQTTKFYSEE